MARSTLDSIVYIHRVKVRFALASPFLLIASFLSVSSFTAAHADTPDNSLVPSTLKGHAYLPALSLLVPPADAPQDVLLSGKFITEVRNDQPMSQPGDTGTLHGNRLTGLSLPFIGQPLQGFSGFAMNTADDESVYALIDNGFGSKRNSTDAMLRFHRIKPDWDSGNISIAATSLLHDPDGIIPFRIVHEGTEKRYLTGGDFDPESIQVIDDTVWIGEEFGPYLIRSTLGGRITGLFETELQGAILRSPDHPQTPNPATAGQDFRVPRSGGFEGMALTPDGSSLWAMLEKPLLDSTGEPEGNYLQVLQFDPVAASWTGESLLYPLEEGATAIGDFNFIDETRALVIERDNGEGDPSLLCADVSQPQPDCFPSPAKFKQIVLIDTASIDENGFVEKLAHIDLMDIDDPSALARLETDAARDLDGKFTFPFFTIESVMRLDDTHIMVAMDNNLPFSSGRKLDQAADNEFILLDVADLLDQD